MNFLVTIKKKKKLNERRKKKRPYAKLECHLAGFHALSHEVSKRETFCNNFYSTIFLQKIFFYSFLKLNNYNGYVCTIYKCCFIAYLKPSQGKFKFLKKIMKPKINAKE